MTTSVEQGSLTAKLRWLLEKGEREAARRGEPVLVSATDAAPSYDPVALFDRAGAHERALWQQPSEDFSLVAVGAAAQLTGRGEARFSQVAGAWRRLLSGAVIDAAGACPVAPPACLGGFAFDSLRRRDPPWEDYPDALLMVPRFLFASSGGSSWLTVNTMVSGGLDVPAAADAVAASLHGLLSGAGAVKDAGLSGGDALLEDDTQADRWKATVRTVVGDIRQGSIEKLVLARQVRARSVDPLEPGPHLRRLRSGYGGCTIFAFARGESCFLGATPERLVRLDADGDPRSGRLVRADCLAGSTARGITEEEDRSLGEALLADGKERHEHALVVRALRDALGPLCSHLSVPETPRLLRMPNVQHLHTPVRGLLNGERHVLELVERLHPTPAAGGLPRRAALSLIRAYEPFDRGWYAGPVGWIDGRGGGDFAVAIRSALLRSNEALLYAGCGIVADSDPQREYEESCLKLRPMLWALNGK